MRSTWNRPALASLRLRSRGVFTALATVLLGVPLTARAESMDFALERLVRNPDCRTDDGFAVAGKVCQPDNAAFTKLVNQYGMALAPNDMYPAQTTGYGGFEIAVDGTYTTVHGKSDYMRLGTRGSEDSSTGEASTENSSPASLLQLYSLRIRKGFGFGIETGLQFGVMPRTSLISGGADLRLALFEGFRSGIPGYIPDLAAVGSVRTITGTPQVQLTVAGVGAILSKQITIAESGVLTPTLGYQYLWIFGDSGVVDFTPAENALQACGYSGPDVPGNPSSEYNDGSPVCEDDGTVSDFNNNKVFDPVRIQRQRLTLGLHYRYEILTVGTQIMADVFNSAVRLNRNDVDRDGNEIFEQEKGQGNVHNFAFAFQVGAVF